MAGADGILAKAFLKLGFYMSVKLALQLGVVSALGVCVAPPLWSGQLAGGSEQVEVSEERVSALEQRVSRAEAFFEELSGSERAAGMTLPQSFPKYVGAPLSDVDYLRLARSEIRAAFEQRARVRRASAPDGLDEDEQAAWEQRLRRQLELEDRLDLLRERVLAGLIDGLRVAPGFESDSFERQLESFRDLRRASVLAGTREQALELVELESRLVRYRSAAYRRMIQGDDGRLSELVNLDLEVLGDHDADLPETDVVAMARLDRLRRALPLLDASLAARVVEALGEPPAGAAGVGLSVSTDTDTGDTSADNLPSASERLAVLRERLSAIESAETRRAALVASELNRLSEQVDSLGSQSAEARGASRFEPSRADRLDAAYRARPRAGGDDPHHPARTSTGRPAPRGPGDRDACTHSGSDPDQRLRAEPRLGRVGPRHGTGIRRAARPPRRRASRTPRTSGSQSRRATPTRLVRDQRSARTPDQDDPGGVPGGNLGSAGLALA